MFDLFTNQTAIIWFFVRAFLFVFAGLFVIYSLVVFGQARTLTKTVKTDYGILIYFLSFIQLLIAFVCLILPFMIA